VFRPLRVRLTALYVIAGVMLITLVGAGTYALIGYFFQSTTDLALQHVMAQQFTSLDVPVPVELADADRAWSESQPGAALNPVMRFIPKAASTQDSDAEGSEREDPGHEEA